MGVHISVVRKDSEGNYHDLRKEDWDVGRFAYDKEVASELIHCDDIEGEWVTTFDDGGYCDEEGCRITDTDKALDMLCDIIPVSYMWNRVRFGDMIKRMATEELYFVCSY